MKNQFCFQPTVLWVTLVTMAAAALPAGAQGLLAPTNYPVGVNPYSVEVGDLDGDGNSDLVSANLGDNTVSVLLGRGNGTFRPAISQSAGSNPISVVLGNFDSDSYLDVVVADYGSNSIGYLRGNGNGTLQPPINFPTGTNPYEVIAGDFNKDGKLDIAAANGEASSLSVLLGNGDGTFGAKVDYSVGSHPYALAQGYFNNDSFLDLVSADFENDKVSVLLGNPNGTFQSPVSYPTGDGPRGVVARDLNGDGFIDIATANQLGNTVSVLAGTGTGSFNLAPSYIVGQAPVSIVAADLDGNGKVDLATANASSNTVSVLSGNGDLTFTPAATYPAGANTLGIAAGQLNPGGQVDLATANRSANSVSVFLNSADIVTNTKDSGSGSLRQAILNANATAGDDTITFDPTVFSTPQTITLSGTQLPIVTSVLTITGPAARVTIDGNAQSRIFECNTGANVSISNLTFFNGKTPTGEDGGAISNSGYNDSTLLLSNCSLIGNNADNDGGALATGSSTTLQNCIITGNSAQLNGGAIVNSGYLTILDSTISNNTASNNGGALFNFETVTLKRCTINDNTATYGGGGMVNTREMYLTNCTLSGNQATDAFGIGGGIYNYGYIFNVESCTASGNHANNTGGGIYNDLNCTFGLRNSIVAGNTGDTAGPDLYGSVTSGDYNLVQDISGATLVGTHNITGQSPHLGPLADNGGPTQTMALLAGSPSLNAGNTAATSDQRGLPRPQGIADDIGAFEYQLPSFSINDATVTEGNSGPTNATFTVTLSVPSIQTVTVSYGAIVGSTNPATLGSDFLSTKGTLTFASGDTTKTVTVPIVGDYVPEADETFVVKLSSPVNATISDGQGLGTITNDDFDTTPPTVSFTTSTTTPTGTTPASGGTIYNVVPAITGVAADAGSGIVRVQLRLYRATSTAGVYEYWNGTGWIVPSGSVAIPLLTTTLSGPAGSANVTWSRSTGWPTGGNFADGTYYLTAYAYDRAGKLASSSRNFKKLTDNTGPSVSFTTSATTPTGTTPVSGSTVSNTMPTITGVAADSASGIAKVELRLYRATSIAGVYENWTGSTWTTTLAALSTVMNPAAGGASVSWSRSSGWPSGGDFADGTYYLRATAYDKVGNLTATLASNFKKVTSAGQATQLFENEEPSQ